MRVNPEWNVVYKSAIGKDGELLFPERLTREFLTAARRTMGPYLFANQYENICIPDGMQTFKKSWKRYWHTLPETLYHYAFVDPAISEADTADYTGIVVVSVDSMQNWYLRYARRHRLNPSQLIEMLFKIYDRFKTNMIGIENVAFQRAIVHFAGEEMRRRNKYIPVTGINLGTDKTKEMRILSLVPRFEMGSILLTQGLEDLERELDEFPRGAHDDVCFVAGTMVATPTGWVPIESLLPGDKVITPRGLDSISHTSNRLANVITNIGLTGTADHPIFTEQGIVSLIDVSASSKLSSFSCKGLIRQAVLNSFISTVLNSDEWVGREAITFLNSNLTTSEKQKRWGFTSLFLSFIRERKYQKGSTFTIKTVTHSITLLKIWSVFQLKSTQRKHAEILQKCLQTSKEFAPWQRHGTNQSKVANGIESMRSAVGKIGSWWRSFALNARNHLPLISQPLLFAQHAAGIEGGQPLNYTQKFALFVAPSFTSPTKPPKLAQTPVAPRPKGLRSLLTHGWILNVHNALHQKEFGGASFEKRNIAHRNVPHQPGGQECVYNIRTRDHHYFYANGTLVSNCDALASIDAIISYPTERKNHNEPGPGSPDYEKWYIQNRLAKGNLGE